MTAGKHEARTEYIDVDDMELGGVYIHKHWIVLRIHLD